VPPTKKNSKAVQAVVEEEQRQMEMSFADQVEMQIEEIDGGDRDRLDTVVNDLDGLESQLKQGEGVSG
jgi:type IV secretion system protein VirD4